MGNSKISLCATDHVAIASDPAAFTLVAAAVIENQQLGDWGALAGAERKRWNHLRCRNKQILRSRRPGALHDGLPQRRRLSRRLSGTVGLVTIVCWGAMAARQRVLRGLRQLSETVVSETVAAAVTRLPCLGVSDKWSNDRPAPSGQAVPTEPGMTDSVSLLQQQVSRNLDKHSCHDPVVSRVTPLSFVIGTIANTWPGVTRFFFGGGKETPHDRCSRQLQPRLSTFVSISAPSHAPQLAFERSTKSGGKVTIR